MNPIDQLRARYPFPEKRPDRLPFDWPLDGGGRHLVTNLIAERDIRLMVEVGVFFGNSAKRWLDVSSELTLIGVDPWGPFVNYFDRSIETYDKKISYGSLDRSTLRQQLVGDDATRQCVLSNLWEYRDRFIPMQGRSPEALYEIHDLGVRPELIYIDSNKHGDELDFCYEAFPGCVICGDDWTWCPEDGFPIQKAVRPFAESRGLQIVNSNATWVLLDQQ